MSEPKHAKQLSTTLDDALRGPQNRLQLKENGHDVGGQLAQNAQIKAQMMAQMKARGGAVQRQPILNVRDWNIEGLEDARKAKLTVSNAEDACAVLRFVWPNQGITNTHCQSREAQTMASTILTDLVRASDFIAKLPRAAAPTKATPLWLYTQAIGIIYRSSPNHGIAMAAIHAARGTHKAELHRIKNSVGVETSERGLGF